MLDDRNPQLLRHLQRLAHQFVIQNGFAIVAYGDGAGAFQLGIIGEFLPLAAARGGRHRKHVHQRTTLRVLHPARDCRQVVHRSGVRHGADRGESSGCRRRRTAGDGFLMRLSRLSQMNVRIDKSRRDDQSLGVDAFAGFALQLSRLRQLDDAAILDQDVAFRFQVLRRIDHRSTKDRQ